MNINFTQNLWAAKEWARVNATGDHFVTMVHEATNEEKWGPTGEQMENICRNYPRGGTVIMEELQWKLKSRDKAWRPCYKSLLVIDYLARNVKDTYLAEICSLVPTLRNIAQSFYYTNPKGVDHGVSVRERAKNLADLLSDGLLLREERAKAAATKAKLASGSSDGGGPGAFRSGDRYGGYGGDSSGSNGAFYAGSGLGMAAARMGGYDPYPAAARRRAPSPLSSVPRTKEEQERYDMEMALRLQREEERRAGVSAEQLESMYAMKVQKRQERTEERKRYAGDDDEELARRLQEEEEARARREGRALPTLRSDQSPATPTPPPPQQQQQSHTPAADAPPAPAPAPTKAPEPKKDVLDDLFAPAPPPPQPQQAQQQFGQGGGAGGDPFDTFLDSRAQQQQQWTGGAPQQPQQGGGWGQPQMAADNWGQPQQAPWSAPPQQQPQQPGGDPWNQPPSQQQWSASPQPTSGNAWSQPPAQQPWGGGLPQAQQSPAQQQSADPWNQPQQWSSPPQQPSMDPWNQPQQQQQQASNDPWDSYSNASGPSAAGNINNSSSNGAGAEDPMWAAFGQFNQQQQRKR